MLCGILSGEISNACGRLTRKILNVTIRAILDYWLQLLLWEVRHGMFSAESTFISLPFGVTPVPSLLAVVTDLPGLGANGDEHSLLLEMMVDGLATAVTGAVRHMCWQKQFQFFC